MTGAAACAALVLGKPFPGPQNRIDLRGVSKEESTSLRVTWFLTWTRRPLKLLELILMLKFEQTFPEEPAEIVGTK